MAERHWLAVAVACTLIAAGIALKLDRYQTPAADHDAAFEARLVSAAADAGWRRRDEPERHGEAFRLMTFHKQGCQTVLRLAVIGTTDGLHSYLVRTYGEDVRYLQHGELVERPSALTYQAREAAKVIGRTVGLVSAAPTPLVAVINGAQAGVDCRGPAASNWRQFLNS